MGDPFYPAFHDLGQRLLGGLTADIHECGTRGSLRCYLVTELEYYALLASVCTEEELEMAAERLVFMHLRGLPVIWE